MSTYKENFITAIERGEEFGLENPVISFSDDRILTFEVVNRIHDFFNNEMQKLTVKELYRNCMGVHFMLLPYLEDLLDTEVYFTLGNVMVLDKPAFQMKEAEMKKVLQSGVEGPLLIHAWLTLPTMEILDFSISTTYSVQHNLPEGRRGIIAKHPDELINGLVYEPMLVGDDFLRKSGALFEFEW